MGLNSSYTQYAGNMTLVLELSQSRHWRRSSQEKTLEAGQPQTTSVNNEADARLPRQNWRGTRLSIIDAARVTGDQSRIRWPYPSGARSGSFVRPEISLARSAANG